MTDTVIDNSTADNASPQKTPLYESHKTMGGKLVDFGGWLLPVNYTSQVEEHHAVRNDAGMFDVSHMTVSDIVGNDTLSFLSTLLANDIQKATTMVGKALYSCMLDENGGVIDDLIVYYLNDTHCRLVTNAATNAKDMAWIQQQAKNYDVVVTEKPDLALIAVQGPNAIKKVTTFFSAHDELSPLAELITSLKRFQGKFLDKAAAKKASFSEYFVGRTGYTGEDGIEMILPADNAAEMWDILHTADILPCGLGARDTLRLEAGMALYGSDLSEAFTPLESGLSWTVSLKTVPLKNDSGREFIGKSALLTPAKYKMIGLLLIGKGVLRGHQTVLQNGEPIGEITSGTFSPSLGQSIALARISNDVVLEDNATLQVQIRKNAVDVNVVPYPFFKK